ncbi:hypothetical protein Q5P01_024094 [Channa striata]|uniref:Uncharacterized protein n=1 Tax=Channa striata TaxID=64152 RepID=A0AA88LQ86_CHASR|nr:hypothetical protein Q5P01_024094 [Channa striata]
MYVHGADSVRAHKEPTELPSPDYEPIEKMLNLQSRHKLAFVNQVLYNANTVTFSKRDEWKRILSTTGIGLNLSIKGKWKEKMPVTVAPGCTFAFSLTVLDSYNGKLVIPIRTRTVKRMHIHGLQNLGQSKTNQYIQQKPQKYNNEEEGENTEDRDGEEEEAAEQK